MLVAAADRVRTAPLDARVFLAAAPMTRLPFADQSFDFIVAQGIWNLARSSAEFRAGVAEAARVARPGAPLFVFTFSRHTLPDSAEPVPGETFVFTQFSGAPQCFLTEAELIDELSDAGFVRDTAGPLTEYNRGRGLSCGGGGPVIYEGLFRRASR